VTGVVLSLDPLKRGYPQGQRPARTRFANWSIAASALPLTLPPSPPAARRIARKRLFQLEESSFVPIFEGSDASAALHGAANRRFERVSHRHEEAPAAYDVVVNHEEQYSIWRSDREPPRGWRRAGKAGSREECLDYIREVWTDMRPLSLRQKQDAAG
jgi:MbtH protein